MPAVEEPDERSLIEIRQLDEPSYLQDLVACLRREPARVLESDLADALRWPATAARTSDRRYRTVRPILVGTRTPCRCQRRRVPTETDNNCAVSFGVRISPGMTTFPD